MGQYWIIIIAHKIENKFSIYFLFFYSRGTLLMSLVLKLSLIEVSPPKAGLRTLGCSLCWS